MEEKWHKNDKEIVGQANKKSDERRNQAQWKIIQKAGITRRQCRSC